MPECRNGSTSHGMRDRWLFGTPRTGSSRFSIPTHLLHQFPNSEIATPFRDFVYREFETLSSKNHLSSRFPEPSKCRNATSKILRVSRLRVFSVKCPDSLSMEMPETSIPEMPKCPSRILRVSRLRAFQCRGSFPFPCHRDFWYAEL
jgi:hypothetical protein